MNNALHSAGNDFKPSTGPQPPRVNLLEAGYARMLATAGIRINGRRAWDMRITDARLWRRIALGGTLGLGDAYVDGWWDSPRLDEFFARLVRCRIDRHFWNLPKHILGFVAAIGNLQNVRRARRVGEQHYDLSNDLYRAMLGERMVYTCGYWRDAGTLDEAQEHKLELVCRKLMLEPGMRVLDIGCGWGSFARYAAERYGVEVVGVTISSEQAARAREACAGLPVDIRVQDYREVDGRYDRIVSLGMFEHVGRKNYRRYMQVVHERLVTDGIFVMQVIGLNGNGSGIDPWVTRHIFPNSEIPTSRRLTASFEGLLKLEDWHCFGQDYDRTLMAWHANFAAAWHRFEATFGPRFHRLWTYYLLMFAGVFRGRGLDLWQLVLTPRERLVPYQRPLY
jgi:cyclopropane-fatty-acyl-phospholipid synthase